MAKMEEEGIKTREEFRGQLAQFMKLEGVKTSRESWDMEWICWGRDHEREEERRVADGKEEMEGGDDDDNIGSEVFNTREEDDQSYNVSRTAIELDTYEDIVMPSSPIPPSSPLSSVPSIDDLNMADEEMVDLATFPSCLRCIKRRNGCDRRRPICGRCEAAGVGEEGCVSEQSSKAKVGVFGKKTGKMVSLKEIVTTTTSGLAPGLETAPASPHVGVIALALEARQSGAKEPEENEMDEEDNTEEEANTEEENKQKNRSNDNDISRLFPTIPCSPITSEAGTNPEKQKKAPELYFHSSTRAARFLGERR